MDKNAFMRRIDGKEIASLKRFDLTTFHLMIRQGIAKRNGTKVARVPVAYGDGKKSPYGPTYADELNDNVLW